MKKYKLVGWDDGQVNTHAIKSWYNIEFPCVVEPTNSRDDAGNPIVNVSYYGPSDDAADSHQMGHWQTTFSLVHFLFEPISDQ